MPLVAPNLDDRTFEDLLREARARIPRYCPDWTDFNDSDPGTALVQLFAWFTDQMLWRLNRVPERNYIKFLQLLNLELRPARPARAHVCFELAEPATATTVPVRTRFEVPGGTDGGVLHFETTRPLDLVPYALDTVQVVDGTAVLDVSAANAAGNGRFRPLGWSPRVGNALYLGFRPPKAGELKDEPPFARERGPVFPQRLALRFYLPPSDPSVRAEPSRGAVPRAPDQTLVYEYQSELDGAADRWRPLAVLADDTAAFAREGTVELRGPGSDLRATDGPRAAADGRPRYWIRCRLAGGVYDPTRVPEIALVRPNAVEVENLATVTDELLGESDGFPKEFALRNRPVDPESLQIEIEAATGAPPEAWTRVDDFLASKSDSAHYTLNATGGTVQFGNGRNGMVPPPGALVVARSYRSGGGAAGNVSAGAIAVPPIGVPNLETVTNPRPAVGGADEESLESLKARAPLALRGTGRAVTADDYRQIAEEEPGVAKAAVLERYHPQYPGIAVPGCVTVAIVPDDGAPPVAGEPFRPMPSRELLDRVARRLNARRTLGTELFVSEPHYRRIAVRVRVAPAGGASDAQVKEGVRRAIENYLAPVRSANRPGGWPFREPFFPSRLYEVVAAATDDAGRTALVQRITDLSVQVDGLETSLGTAIEFVDDQLPAVTAAVELDAAYAGGARP